MNSFGGMLVLLSKAYFAPPLALAISFQELSPGRAVQLTVRSTEGIKKQFDCFFVHNFGLTFDTTSSLIKKLDNSRISCFERPDKFSMAILGDFNLEPRGSLKISLLDSSSLSRSLPPQVPPRPFEKKWNTLFDKLVEVDFPFPSHVNSSTLVISRINRVFLGVPKSAVPLLNISAGVKRDPTWYEGLGLSDHAPIFIKIGVSMNKPRTSLRIKPEWCKHPSFLLRLTQLSGCISWERYTLDEQSILLKEIQRDAALFARDQLFIENPTSNSSLMTRLASIARCVWSNDKRLYTILVRHAELARTHLTVSEGKIALLDPLRFEEEMRTAKTKSFAQQRRDVLEEFPSDNSRGNNSIFSAGRKKCKLEAISRQNALWLPATPRLIVIGSRLDPVTAKLVLDDDELSQAPCDVNGSMLVTGKGHTKALIHIWKKVFGTRALPPLQADLDELLSAYDTNKWDWGAAKQFDINLVIAYVAHLRHTGSGKDGIHNFCFKYGDRRSIEYLVRLFHERGCCTPSRYKRRLILFLIKSRQGR